jgi:FtsX-like permease family
VIRLAARISLAGGAEAVTRLVATALGLALGVGLLLYAAAAFPALHAHDVRAGWYATSARNRRPAQDEATTDPLLWRLTADRFGDRDLIRVDVAAEGPRAPLPPGLARLPGPGQLAVSPALARLLRTTDPALLGDRLAGQVVQTIGPAALIGPDDLVAVAGHTPAQLRAQGGATEVRSIEAAPHSHSVTSFMRIILVVGSVGLIVPVVVFVATATRLAAARREQRLAALRLVGATPRQTAMVAAVEAALAAVAGTAIGVAAFVASRPLAAHFPFDGSPFYTADLRPFPVWTVVVVLGVPALSVVAAIVSLRRVNISPLGVTRAAQPSRPTARRLIPVVVGLVLLAVAFSGARTGSQGLLALGAVAFAIVIVGIMLAGPWLTAKLAAALAHLARRPPLLLAARRLHDNPSAGFRAISGLVVAAFVTSVFSGLTPAVVGQANVRGGQTTGNRMFAPLASATADFALPTGRAATLLRTLTGTPGVAHVAAFRPVPAGLPLPAGAATAATKDGRRERSILVLARCADLAAASLATCPARAATALVRLGGIGLGKVDVAGAPARPVPAAALDALPLAGLVAVTDGRTATFERVRTAIEASAPAAAPVTDADLSALHRQLLVRLQRLCNVGLLLALLVAGCSLAVAVSAGLIERKRPFALLRLTGAPASTLDRVVLAEAAAPLLLAAVASAGLGLAVAAMILKVVGVPSRGWNPPGISYWAALAGGILLALLAVAATLPLLKRVTSLETARFE